MLSLESDCGPQGEEPSLMVLATSQRWRLEGGGGGRVYPGPQEALSRETLRVYSFHILPLK